MSAPSDDIAAPRVTTALLSLEPGWSSPVVVFGETESTNDDARRLAREGCPHGTIVLADAQSRGRGRAGRAWHSPPGCNVYLSIVLRPRMSVAAIAPFTLAVGLAVACAVEARIDRPTRLKWPNDVFVDRLKIAGILAEGQVRGDALASLVVGIGLDVGTTQFPAPLETVATSLALLGARDRDRARLVAELATQVVVSADRFDREGLAPFLDGVRQRDALVGRNVAVGDVTGIARGIADDGSLLVAVTNERVERVVSGTVVPSDEFA